MMTEGTTIGWAILLTRAGLFLETAVDRRADVGAELFQICSIGKMALIWRPTLGEREWQPKLSWTSTVTLRHNFDTKDAKALLKPSAAKALTGAGLRCARLVPALETRSFCVRSIRLQRRPCFFRGSSAVKLGSLS